MSFIVHHEGWDAHYYVKDDRYFKEFVVDGKSFVTAITKREFTKVLLGEWD